MTIKTTKKITMPQLGESITEGTINAWLVKEGDRVNKYDPIADIMTDKVNAEVPTFFSGIVKEIVTKEGETIEVGEVMCYIETEIDEPNPLKQQVEKRDESKHEQPSNDSKDTSMRNRYSPAVLRLAQEHKIDLEEIEGTGRGGRITRKDVEQFIQALEEEKQISTVTREEDFLLTEEQSKEERIQTEQITSARKIEIPVTRVRKKIAENMVRAKHEIPHAWMTIEVDVTNMVRFRDRMKDDFIKREGYNITYFSFFMKAVAQALKEYPRLNSTWQGDKIIEHQEINLSFAVAKENELFMPVIRNADEKSIKGIAKEIHELAQKARSGKLTVQDVEGGTFTINNTGSFGSIQSMGIINYPQAAILQVESIVKRPVIIDDMFAARDMVNLCLSLDHRILDGLVCGRFMARVREFLENINDKETTIF